MDNGRRITSFILTGCLLAGLFLYLSFSSSQAASYAGLQIRIIPGPQCYDGQDNDSDGKIDYPDDDHCDSANDNSEGPIIIAPPDPGNGGGGNGGGNRGGNGGGGGGGITITPVTSVTLSGYAHPRNKVFLLKDGEITATTQADSDAKFRFALSDLSAGDYLFSFYSEDSSGNRSDSFSFSLTVSKGAATNIGGIFLAPTLSLNSNQFISGQELSLMGQTVPGAQVRAVINSATEHQVTAKSDQNGFYLMKFDTNKLEIGSHTAKTRSKTGAQESSYSRLASFEVLSPSPAVSDEPKKPEAPQPPKEEKKNKADLNSDKKVNLVDFSIMAYWYKKNTPPAVVDLNGDKKVDLIDFSILAFNWSG